MKFILTKFCIFFPSFLQPRLGPKPFSVGSGDVNFDKVFSVPQVPGSERITATPNYNEVISDNQNKSTESSDSSIDEQKDSDEKEGNFISHALCIHLTFLIFHSTIDAIVYRNGNNGHAMHKSDSLEEDLQRAISTAERRKVRLFIANALNFNLNSNYLNYP